MTLGALSQGLHRLELGFTIIVIDFDAIESSKVVFEPIGIGIRIDLVYSLGQRRLDMLRIGIDLKSIGHGSL